MDTIVTRLAKLLHETRSQLVKTEEHVTALESALEKAQSDYTTISEGWSQLIASSAEPSPVGQQANALLNEVRSLRLHGLEQEHRSRQQMDLAIIQTRSEVQHRSRALEDEIKRLKAELDDTKKDRDAIQTRLSEAEVALKARADEISSLKSGFQRLRSAYDQSMGCKGQSTGGDSDLKPQMASSNSSGLIEMLKRRLRQSENRHKAEVESLKAQLKKLS